MSNAFLDALKKKSSAIQSARFNPAPVPVQPPQPTPAPDVVDDSPIDVRIELVQAKNGGRRIDVFFSRKPDARTRVALKNHNFWFNGERGAWFNADTEENRLFLSTRFGVVFEEEDTTPITVSGGGTPPTPSDPPADETPAPSNPEGSEEVGDKPMPEEYQRYLIYKRQVAELIDHLKIEAADLQLLMTDAFHKATFGQN